MKKVFLLIALTLPSLAVASFPFPNGVHEGKSKCWDESGSIMEMRVQLIVSGDSLETTYFLPEGSLNTKKKAAFDSMGFFTLTGNEIISGNGYCTAGFCHYQAVMDIFGTKVEGEDSLFMVEGLLRRIGSSTGGTRGICEEVYDKFSKTF
jgi:hypothetical protein